MALNIQKLADAIVEPIRRAQAHHQCRIDAGCTLDDVLWLVYISAARQLAEKVTRRAFFNQTWQRTLDNFPLAASFDYTPSPADKWNWPVYGGMWNRLTIDLPMGRALAINAITYIDASGNPQTLPASQYYADLSGIPCRLTPSQAAESGMVWPWQGSYLPGSVNIQWQAGSYVQLVTETFQAPSAAPWTYQLKQPSVTAVVSVVNAAGASVTGWTFAPGLIGLPSTLTLPAAEAGLQLTVSYYVAALPADLLVAMLMLVGHFYRNPEATTDLKMEQLPIGVQALLSSHVVEWTDYRPC